jgi:hypothetical protein
LNKIEKWIYNHPALARLVLLALAGINAWSAWHIFSRSPILGLAQGTLSILLLLGAILAP